MRVLVDTSVFIAYLLRPRPGSFVDLLFDNVVSGDITLLICGPLLDEIASTVRRKPRLIQAITEKELGRFLSLLKSIAEDIPLIDFPIPPISRDPADDFLIAYAVLGGADYLVTVEKDLLVLEEAGRTKILHTAAFREILAN